MNFLLSRKMHILSRTKPKNLKSQLLEALWVSTRDSLYKNDDCLKMNTLLSLLVNTQYFIEYYFNIMEGKIVCSLLDNNARNGNRQRSSTCSLDSFRSNNESTTFTRGFFLPLVWSLLFARYTSNVTMDPESHILRSKWYLQRKVKVLRKVKRRGNRQFYALVYQPLLTL